MKRPVTIVTGYLGSGKTTLLVNMLKDPSLRNTAVLVNEFGQVGLDHHLLRQVDERARLISGGCLCCTVREDLVKELTDLLNKDQSGEIPGLERVVLETSGLADPAPILFTILSNPVLQHHYEVERIITVVDAVNAGLHLERHPETAKQVAAADRIVITKTDLVSEETKAEVMSEISRLNPLAEIAIAVYGETDAGRLFSGPGTGRDLIWGAGLPAPAPSHPQQAARSLSLTFDRPIDWNAFGLWLSMLLHAHGDKIMRVKGLLDVGGPGPVLLNGVQHIIHPPEHLSAWPESCERRSQVVFIMKSVEADALLQSLHSFQAILGAKADLSKMEIIHA
ncbi:CobW family GTP-binding protein [Paenibacillus hamazuiensis]|uniref:CobW family GTP-binding protein n=1 Tax=Paenibacillus hamazuiensis TaxID=2936508 RepID=UPI00200F4F79|nr:GTP-binding protein [Paenibacillus hamazuiensis]